MEDIRIAASADDVEESRSGSVDFTSSDLELVDDGSSGRGQTIGLRFNGLDVPQGADILRAYIQFQVDETDTRATTLRIRGEDTDNASVFVRTAFNVSSRQPTAATVEWTPTGWTKVGDAGANQQTADISSIVQEIVDRAGWRADNSIALIITGSGERTAEAYDGNASAAPLLHVEWATSGGGPVAFNTPADVDSAADRIAENAAIGTRVGVTASAADPDAGDTVTYSVDDPRFRIDAGGVITRSGTGVLDFQAEPTVSLAVTATSTDASHATRNITLSVLDSQQAPHVAEVRIAASAGDVEESRSGSVDFTSSDLELVDDGSSGRGQTIGLRFNGLDVPQGADILRAYIQFQVDETDTRATALRIRGEDTDNAAVFARTAFNVSSRQPTAATVEWTPTGWTRVGDAGANQQTADVSSIVQEIVDRAGWRADNSIALIITGSGERTAEAYDGNASAAPLLHVEWATSGGGPDTTPPTVTLQGPTDGATVSGAISLTAAAFDNVAIRDVQFRLDSENLDDPDTSAPYTNSLDTTQFSDGTVALTAVATDSAGNQTVSSPLTVTIDNGTIEPPPPPPPSSGTIRVPQDYATIQEAVNAAGDGDTVLVGPGTYTGGIVISGKSITLAAQYHATDDVSLINQATISGGSPAIYVDGSAPDTVIQGFHFVGGSKSVQFFAQDGQALDNFFDNTGSDAISFENVGGIARGNRIFSPSDDGVDVDYTLGDVLIENNIIEFAGDDGIEIRNGNYSGPLFTQTIRNNIIVGSSEDGIQIIDYSANSDREFRIERNLIRTSEYAGLGLMDGGETVEDFRAASMPERIYVFNNTFDGNNHGISGGDNLIAVNNIVSNSSVLGLKNINGSSVVADTLFFNNSSDYIGSNVDVATTKLGDPLYTSTFGLRPGSPAIDAGAILFVHNGETVLDLGPSEYKGATSDLGWFEF